MRRHGSHCPHGRESQMDIKTVLLLAVGGLVLLAAAAQASSAPIKQLLKAAFNTVLGLAALLVVNATSSITGLSLGFNLFNALVVGVLGVPGLILLLLVQWVLT